MSFYEQSYLPPAPPPPVSPVLLQMAAPPAAAAHDDTLEMILGTLLILGILGLLIYRQNFRWLQSKSTKGAAGQEMTSDEAKLIDGTPSWKKLMFVVLGIGFAMLVVVLVGFKKG